MLGVVKKTLLADTLAHGADMVFARRSGHGRLRSGLARGAVLHLPDLLRLFRLFGHGDRPCADARLPAARELQHAVSLVQHHRVLAALAHLAVHLDPRVSLHSARRQPRARRGATSICGSASSPPACGTAPHGPTSPGAPTTACFSCSTSCSCCGRWTGCRVFRQRRTFLIVVIGWTLFRASLDQAGAFWAQ